MVDLGRLNAVGETDSNTLSGGQLPEKQRQLERLSER